MLTKIVMQDIHGSPSFKLDIPLVRIGELIRVRVRLARVHEGRHEVLLVNSSVRVDRVGVDATHSPPQQVIQAAHFDGKPTHWQAVKTPGPRKMAPAKAPKTILED